MQKVLILCPHLTEKGGVAYYYRKVKKNFKSDRIVLNFYYTGQYSKNGKYRNKILKSFSDLFFLVRIFPRYDLIILNPSLNGKAVARDGVFNFIAKKIFKKKTLVFFRGWDPEFEKLIDRYFKRVFKILLNADKFIVLSKDFKEKLILWEFNSERIVLETTTFEKQEILFNKDRYKILFLSRFSKNKGGLEAIETIELLVEEFPNIELFMIGDGELNSQLREYVTTRNLTKNVTFTGWLEAEEKKEVLSNCGIMLYPTSYGEGMPNCLIEGMGYGLAIITRPVAGIPEIIENKVNGFLLKSVEPKHFAIKLKFLLKNKNEWQKISDFNKKEAKVKYEIKNVVKRLEQLYFELSS